MSKRDLVAGGVALAFGAAAAYESAKLPFGTVRSPGQGFFPWWTGVALALLALVLLVQTLGSRSNTVREGSGGFAKVSALLLVLLGYTLLLDSLGYPLCTFLLVLFMLRVTDPQRWSLALGIAGITAIGSYVIFAFWLGVPLPRGALWESF